MRGKDLVEEIDKSKSYYWQALVRTAGGASDVYPNVGAGRFVAPYGRSVFLQASAHTEVKDGAAALEETNMKSNTPKENRNEAFTVFCKSMIVFIETNPLIESSTTFASTKTAEDGFDSFGRLYPLGDEEPLDSQALLLEEGF